MTNPNKRRRRTRSKNSASRRRTRRNPFSSKAMRKSYRRVRRNPSIGGFSGSELLKLAVGAAGGSIGARFLTQAVLKDKNTGVTGYAANAASALALAWLAAKFLGKDIATGVAAGGLGAIVARIWSDQVSGTSAAAAMSGLGDLDFSGDGLGAYIESGFPLPTQSSLGPGNYLSVPTSGPSLASAGAASSAPNVNVQPAVPSGLNRFASRF